MRWFVTKFDHPISQVVLIINVRVILILIWVLTKLLPLRWQKWRRLQRRYLLGGSLAHNVIV